MGRSVGEACELRYYKMFLKVGANDNFFKGAHIIFLDQVIQIPFECGVFINVIFEKSNFGIECVDLSVQYLSDLSLVEVWREMFQLHYIHIIKLPKLSSSP